MVYCTCVYVPECESVCVCVFCFWCLKEGSCFKKQLPSLYLVNGRFNMRQGLRVLGLSV